jgi:uncharacterized protein (DUF1499 family)
VGKSLLLIPVALGLLALLLLTGAILLNRVPILAAPGPGPRLTIYLTENVAETRVNARLPELRPRAFPLDPSLLFASVCSAVTALQWGDVRCDPQGRKIQASVTTPLWRFRDEVSIRVLPRGGNGSELYVVSRARIGRGDLGANLRHILDLYTALGDQLRTRADGFAQTTERQ